MVRPSVLIYRSELLALSETFIAAQAQALRGFAPVLVGLRPVAAGLEPPVKRSMLSQGQSLRSRARRGLFLATGCAPAWIEALRGFHPALMHAHFALDAAEALPLARSLDVPLVVTLHGYDVMTDDAGHRATRRGRLYLRRRERLFREAELFFCVSEAIRRKALARGYPEAKLRVQVIGIDRRRCVPRPTMPAQPLVLFVGRLVEKKGCLHLLRAMQLLERELPAATLVVVGDGPERARLEAEARVHAPGALFLGAQSAEAVGQWMRAARVLAVPSVTASNGDAEGLPTVLGEALATGLPVAAFASSGIPELVRHEREGLLAKERDEEGLARNLFRLCTDDALAAQVSEGGLRRIEAEFDLATQTAALEEAYREVLARFRPRARAFFPVASSTLVDRRGEL